ncbi:MAG: acetyl-CoA carboxylase, carboxyltransferase subunit beta [Wolinella sp.]
MGFTDFFKTFTRERAKEGDSPSHWVKCPGCSALMYYKEVLSQHHVCPKCNFHMRISLDERVKSLCDDGTLVEHDISLEPTDPLTFVDKKSYKKRIEEGKSKTGRASSVLSGECRIDGVGVQIVIFNFAFMGGSLGSVEGEKIVRAVNRAIGRRQGLVILSTSGGARMQESTYSLMQMAKTSAALAKLSEARLPFVSVLTDPTMGGVSASFAFLGDIIIAEPGAMIGFAGARVIKQTIGADLPEGFQTAEFLLDHGLIDMIVHRKDMKKTLGDILRFLNPHDENPYIHHI